MQFSFPHREKIKQKPCQLLSGKNATWELSSLNQSNSKTRSTLILQIVFHDSVENCDLLFGIDTGVSGGASFRLISSSFERISRQ